MAKNAYPYPQDEFDQVDVSSRPKEVHAARRGPWSRIWPFLLVIVLIPAIAFGVVYFLGDRLPNSSKETPSPKGGTEVSPPADDSTSPEPPPGTSAEPETPGPETPEPPAPVVDTTVKVTVYNAGTTRGAAAAAADTLNSGGYANADETFDVAPINPQATTVYYATEEQSATAADIASKLSVTATEMNAQVAGGNIVVVIK